MAYWKVAFLSGVILLLGACASPIEIHNDSVSDDMANPDRAGTRLTPDPSGQALDILNTAYVGGRQHKRIPLEELNHLESIRGSTVEIRIVAPDCCEQPVSTLLASDSEFVSRFEAETMSELEALRQSLPITHSRDLMVYLLAAPYGSGVEVFNDSLLHDDKVKLLVASPVSHNASLANWIMRGVELAAHELLHANYTYLGLGLRRTTQTDEEAAAAVFGICASTRSALALGAKKATLMTSNESIRRAVVRAVPTLPDGRFCPDKRVLRGYSSHGDRGGVLANGLLVMLFPSGVIYVDQREPLEKLLAFCDALTENIPKFSEGELPHIQEKSACR